MTDEPKKTLPPYAAEWMAQWRHAAKELPKIRAKELRELTEESGTRNAIILSPLTTVPLRPTSGLLEWQKWMRLLREANRAKGT